MDQLDRLKARVPSAYQLTENESYDRREDPSAREPTSAANPAANVSIGRTAILSALDTLDVTYVVAGEDLYGIWDNGLFYFDFLGRDESEQIYQISGIWERILKEEDFADVLLFVNKCNIEYAWPRAKAWLDEEDQAVVIGCDVTCDFDSSLGEEQLENLIRTAISTSLTFFDSAEEEFPQAQPLEDAPVRSNE